MAGKSGRALRVLGLASALLGFVALMPGSAAADSDYDAAVAAAVAVDPALDPGPLDITKAIAVGGGHSPGISGTFPPATFGFGAVRDLLTGHVSGHMVVRFETPTGETVTTSADVTCVSAVAAIGGGGTAVIGGVPVHHGIGTAMFFFVTDSGSSTTNDTWGFSITDLPLGPPTTCPTAGPQTPIDSGQIVVRAGPPST